MKNLFFVLLVLFSACQPKPDVKNESSSGIEKLIQEKESKILICSIPPQQNLPQGEESLSTENLDTVSLFITLPDDF